MKQGAAFALCQHTPPIYTDSIIPENAEKRKPFFQKLRKLSKSGHKTAQNMQTPVWFSEKYEKNRKICF
ncbi:MAG: hypothetical protein IKQ91_00945 [Oscillospiraceae bacterium]|nr:hypothetical protein [Oscillospiraceae bacterium]